MRLAGIYLLVNVLSTTTSLVVFSPNVFCGNMLYVKFNKDFVVAVVRKLVYMSDSV